MRTHQPLSFLQAPALACSPPNRPKDLSVCPSPILYRILVADWPADVRGEEVRRELTEGESGVKMTIDIQVVDVKTCQPIVNSAVDFWSANSTVGQPTPFKSTDDVYMLLTASRAFMGVFSTTLATATRTTCL